MGKKMIAMAVAAGFASPMAANAGLYGQLQMEFSDQEACVAGACTLADTMDDKKRGRLGIKGSEDLGNGLSAIYKFEWQVDTSDADIADGAREAFVGLKGDWGTFEAGQLKSAYKYAGGVKYDPFVTTFLEARSRGGMSGKDTDLTNIAVTGAAASGSAGSGAFGHHGFLSDNIAYQNKFGNLAVHLTTSLDETGGPKGSEGDYTASVTYKTKSFEVFAATAKNDASNLFVDLSIPGDNIGDATSVDYSATKFGGQWKSGVHKLSGQFEQISHNLDIGTADVDVWFVGYQFKLGKNTFVAQTGYTDYEVVDLETDYTAFGLIHKYSKKTRIFAGVSLSETDGAATRTDSITSFGLRIDF